MLRGRTLANLNKFSFENHISILARDIVDTQEGIEELADTCLPEHFDALERTLVRIQGIVARPQLTLELGSKLTLKPPRPPSLIQLVNCHTPIAQVLLAQFLELNPSCSSPKN
jgi:hypothetical protein